MRITRFFSWSIKYQTGEDTWTYETFPTKEKQESFIANALNERERQSVVRMGILNLFS